MRWAVTAAGAEVVEQGSETVYGERQFVVRDPAGHHWLIAQHIKDLAPDASGATTYRHPELAEGSPAPTPAHTGIPALARAGTRAVCIGYIPAQRI